MIDSGIWNKMFCTGVKKNKNNSNSKKKYRNVNKILIEANCMKPKVPACNSVKFKIAWVKFDINMHQDLGSFTRKS